MRLSVLIVIALLLGLATGAGIIWTTAPDRPASQSSGEALIGGDFDLVDQDGRPVTNATYADSYRLVYFGYTHCPDVCPTGLATMMEAYAALSEAEREGLIPMFITVDPERDTQEVVKDYVGLFSPDLQGLTGSNEQIEAALGVYRIYAKKATSEAMGDYLMDHSAYTYLIDPQGRYVLHFGPDTDAAAMAERLREAIG